jgi:hypothetical protein
MKKKTDRLVNGFFILSGIPLLTSLGILISAAAGYRWTSDLAFILPLFLGTSIFFVGAYIDAKNEDTYGIDFYIRNRKTKMRSAITGCLLSVVMSIASLFVI